MKFSDPLTRNAVITLAGCAVLLPILGWGAVQAMQRVENVPIHWLPEDFPQRVDYQQFVEEFRSRDVLTVSWEGCTIDDPRLPRFAAALFAPQREGEWKDQTELVGEVITGYDAVRYLMGPPAGLSRRAAVARLRGVLVGADGRTTCAVLPVVTRAEDARAETLDYVVTVAEETLGLGRDQLHLAGSVVDGVAIDAAASQAMGRYAIPSALVSILIAYVCLRYFALTAPIVLLAVLGEILALALVYFAGADMNAVLGVMAPLVFVMTISSGVHLANYYLDEAAARGSEGAARRAVRAGLVPCWVATCTTAIGLASLLISDMEPVRNFGAFAAPSLILTTAGLFLLLPGGMQWATRRHPVEPPKDAPAEPADDALNTFWDRWAQRVAQRWLAITVVGLGTLLVAGVGLAWVDTSVAVHSLLPPSNPTMQDYRWLEDNLGPLIPVEVVVHFPANSPLDLLDKLNFLRSLQRAVLASGERTSAVSALNFAPAIPRDVGVAGIAARTILRRRLESSRQEFIDSHWLSVGPDGEKWRISARVSALGDVDYGRFLDRLRGRLAPLLQKAEFDVSATYTGVMPLVYRAQRALLRDLFASFLMAIVMVALVLMAVLRSVPAGLIAMVPNIFPAAVLFGIMGWLRVPVDIGSVMTASVALGIAVDDTIHFLAWFRRGEQRGLEPRRAVQFACRHCGRAMLQTTLICGLGMLVFALGDFVPTQRFALMMASLLAIALLGDLLLLPALLVGPIGRVFDNRDSKK